MPKYEVHIYGISRSGIHAICNWVMENCNITNLFRKCPQSEIEEKRLSANDSICFTSENKDLSKTEFVESTDRKYLFNILVIRDPFNHFASVIKSNRYIMPKTKKMRNLDIYKRANEYAETKSHPIIDLLKIWTDYANEADGNTNYIQNKIVISYNDWFLNESYRKKISQRLHANSFNKGMNFVSVCGGGSSFDGKKYNGKGSEMDVLNRWKHYQNEEWFVELFNDEIVDLSERIFNFNPIGKQE